MRMYIAVSVACVLVLCTSGYATIIHIPDDQPTIQAGINASNNGDTVLADPGTYIENVDFNGHNVVLASLFLTTQDTSYISSTIIDGNGSNAVITFDSGEDETAQVVGLTIMNGRFSGIRSLGASPKIAYNIIRDNAALGGDRFADGGGVYFENGYVEIFRNEIRNNTAYQGAAMWIENCAGEIHHNLIVNNVAGGVGSGILIYSGNEMSIYNNTICFNGDTPYRGAIFVMNTSSLIEIYNNIVAFNVSHGIGQSEVPNMSVTYNDVYGNSGVDYYNLTADPTDISMDPFFVAGDPFDFHLQEYSPCIDAGDPSSPYDPDYTIADMGALYFNQYVVLPFHLIAPVDDSICLSTPTFVWNSTSDNGAGNPIDYIHYLDDDPAFGSPYESSNLSDTVYVFPEDLPRSTEYFWRVLATANGAPPIFSDENWRFYIDGYPTMPVILGPENGTEADASTYLSWIVGTDPDPMDTVTYTLQADDDSEFGSPEIDVSGISGSGVILDEAVAILLGDLPGFENLQEGLSYYWRVRSDDLYGLNSGFTDGSNWFSIGEDINDPPNPPISGFSPANGEEVISLTPVITWNDATDPDPDDNGDNLRYAIRLSLSEDFSGSVYNDTTDPGINQIQPVEDLEDNSHYFYGVMTIDDEDLSSVWSETQNFWTNHYNFPPEPFPLYEPDDSTNQVVYYTHFHWGNTVDYDPMSTFTFTFEYSTNDQFEDPVAVIEELTDTTLAVETDVLASMGQDLYWRILAVDDDGLTRVGGMPDEEVRFLNILSPGDFNGDGTIYLPDIIYLVAYIRGQVPPPDPLLLGDLDGDCVVYISDVVYLIAYIRGLVPPPDRPDCEQLLAVVKRILKGKQKRY